MLSKDDINKRKVDPPIQEDQPNIAEPYLVINENLFKKKKYIGEKQNKTH